MPRAKKSAGKAAVSQTKTQFVLAHPGLPAREMISKAKAVGMSLTDKYIYSIRSAARLRTPKATPAAGRPSQGLDSLLITVAAEVGLGAAIELLKRKRAEVMKVVGG